MGAHIVLEAMLVVVRLRLQSLGLTQSVTAARYSKIP
jgi:hypothetical protein